jgi:multidrug efflux pump subunit AcrA (membrane-fusion protein)
MATLQSAWRRLSSACLHSLTIAWSYLLALAAAALALLDQLAAALDDAALRQQVAEAVGEPVTAARLLLVISAVTFLARLRGLAAR